MKIVTERQKRVVECEYLIKPIGLTSEAYAIRKTDPSEAYASWSDDCERYLCSVCPRTGAISCDCKGYMGWKNRKDKPACKHTMVVGWLRESADLGPLRQQALEALAAMRLPLSPEQLDGDTARALLMVRDAVAKAGASS